MFELQFILIGVIQGITEFLPISSSGHLVLFGQLSNWEDQGLFTDIAVHFGTLFAVIFYLRKDIFYLFANVFQFKFIKDQIIFKIILSTLPAILVGYFIYDYVSIYFRNIQLIAISSMLFAIILYLADKIQIQNNFTLDALRYLPGFEYEGSIYANIDFPDPLLRSSWKSI